MVIPTAIPSVDAAAGMAGAAVFAAPQPGSHSGATALNPGVAGAEPPLDSWDADFMAWRRSRTRRAEDTREPSAVVSDYRQAPGIRQCRREHRGSRDIRSDKPPRISTSS